MIQERKEWLHMQNLLNINIDNISILIFDKFIQYNDNKYNKNIYTHINSG